MRAKSADNIVVLQKIIPTEGIQGEKSEIEKLDIKLSTKVLVDSGKEAKDDAKEEPSSNVVNSGTTNMVSGTQE